MLNTMEFRRKIFISNWYNPDSQCTPACVQLKILKSVSYPTLKNVEEKTYKGQKYYTHCRF